MAAHYPSSGALDAIRKECFCAASVWLPPTPDEIRSMLEALGISQEGLGRLLGINGRTVRRWVQGENEIAYSAWCVLCEEAGIPRIWRH